MMDTQTSLLNQKTIIRILLTSILTVLLSSYNIFLLSLVPLIFIYYKKGRETYLFVAFVSIILFILWEYITSFRNVDAEALTGSVFSETSINTFELFFYTVVQFIVTIVGCSIFLMTSHYSWTRRIGMFSFVVVIGMFLQLKMIDAMFAVLKNVLKAYTAENNIDGEVIDMFYEHRKALFISITVMTAAWSFILNFMITTFAMCREKGIVFSLYCQYVFRKVMTEYKRGSLIFMLLMIVGVNILDNIASLEILYLLCVGGVTILIMIYVITGIAYGYYLLHTYKIPIRGSWYFFSNSVILILPIINIFLLIVYFLMGIYFDIKKQKINNNLN